jgi:hypothetical protein
MTETLGDIYHICGGHSRGKGEYIARRDDRPKLNSSGRTTGQTFAHSPQAVHSFSLTYLALFRMLISKFPT